MILAADIHARVSWPAMLAQLGIPETALRNKHGPCPACGGKDRFRFDNKESRGSFICSHCGAGDGFKLLQLVHGWTFAQARQRVLEAAGIQGSALHAKTAPRPPQYATESISEPTDRVLRLRRECCAVSASNDAISYLSGRALWPLPDGCTLRAHATVEYWDDRIRIGRFPALLADVVDAAGGLVTAHVTYLQAGAKLQGYEPRKILGPLTGREGCAARLMPADGPKLGIAEGIETALSACLLYDMPVWAALNTSLLAKFEPPALVDELVIFADNDTAGLAAACRLMQRLQGRVRFDFRTPPATCKDFNDVLTAARAAKD